MPLKDKLKLPTTITATYKIITPMFIGDAEQQATTISPQSFKGALRFWWRALAWGRIRQNEANDETALCKLHHQEAVLFGSSADNPHTKDKNKDKNHKIYGKGQVAIKIEQPQRLSPKVTDWPANDQSSSAYLAMGITQSGSGENFQAHREGLPEQQNFTVHLLISSQSAYKEQLITALKLLGFFGGLGGRSRRALGAVQLLKLDNETITFNNKDDYLKQAQTLLKPYQQDLAPYTAISVKTQLSCDGNFSDARITHKELGGIYKNYRGQPSELRGEIKKVFGLPLQQVDMNARRASPLFFHIVEYANGQFGYSVLYMPTSIFHKDRRHQDVDDSLTEGFVQLVGAQQ